MLASKYVSRSGFGPDVTNLPVVTGEPTCEYLLGTGTYVGEIYTHSLYYNTDQQLPHLQPDHCG